RLHVILPRTGCPAESAVRIFPRTSPSALVQLLGLIEAATPGELYFIERDPVAGRYQARAAEPAQLAKPVIATVHLIQRSGILSWQRSPSEPSAISTAPPSSYGMSSQMISVPYPDLRASCGEGPSISHQSIVRPSPALPFNCRRH